MATGKLEALAVPLASPPTPNNPSEPPRSVVELLLRARHYMLRAQESYAGVDASLQEARKLLKQAQEQLAGEQRSEAGTLAAILALRAVEARARGAFLGEYTGKVEGWVQSPLVQLQSNAQAVPAGCCRVCHLPLLSPEALARGYHGNCPDETAPAAQAAQEGGAQ
jgi:hypothetical protein